MELVLWVRDLEQAGPKEAVAQVEATPLMLARVRDEEKMVAMLLAHQGAVRE